jgi:hypothetical protein
MHGMAAEKCRGRGLAHASYPVIRYGAVATVLTDLFGVKAFTDTTHSDHDLTPPQTPRTFRSFDEAAEEAARSRLYGGIHYASGNNNGLAQGRCIGQVILDRIAFKRFGGK